MAIFVFFIYVINISNIYYLRSEEEEFMEWNGIMETVTADEMEA